MPGHTRPDAGPESHPAAALTDRASAASQRTRRGGATLGGSSTRPAPGINPRPLVSLDNPDLGLIVKGAGSRLYWRSGGEPVAPVTQSMAVRGRGSRAT